jgi:hypothetical protein
MTRALSVGLLLLAVAAVPIQAEDPGTAVRAFNLKNATVVEAFTAIEPLLSDLGSVTVQPKRARITVQDSPDVLRRVIAVVSELDRLPGEYRIEVELLEGLDVEQASDLPPELDKRLHRMFPFKSYRRAGRTVFQGELGQATSATLGRSYRLSFLADSFKIPETTPWGVADAGGQRTQVKWLRLDRFVPGAGGTEQTVELLRTTAFLSPRQKMIIGAGSSEDSANGLVLILTMLSVEDR